MANPGTVPASIGALFRRHWGFALFSLASLLSLLILLRQDIPGHYRVFTGAGRALWQLRNPYGADFGTGVGYYFYSPVCGLLFFGPLSFLPEGLGLLLYMALSWATFCWGVLSFGRATAGARPLSPLAWNLFWLIAGSQIWIGILASKVEILMTGLLLIGASWLIEGRRVLLSAALLSMIVNWKFQPLPSLGLIAMTWMFSRRDWKWPLSFALFLAGWFAFPFLIPGVGSGMPEAHATWGRTLDHFVREAFLDFENVYAFLRNSLGVPVSYELSRAIAAFAGAALAATLAAWLWQRRREPDRLNREGVRLALASGAMYTAVFSPLGQNNALIVYAPLLLAGVLAFDRRRGAARTAWAALLILVWAFMTFPYSDLFTVETRDWLRHLHVKIPAILSLGAGVTIYAFRRETDKEEP